ncbi:MAG: hypothetical protein HKN09_04940 [Saprospiraceae bacterium]|nr:hypothetical protein [Saprospiraceae bacterium]
MLSLAKIVVILFGVFIIGVGILMLLRPSHARAILAKAASTPLINYMELTIRMIPAAALVMVSDISKFPEITTLLGWFMLGTSVILMLMPRAFHHGYALYCADILTPPRMRLVSPLSFIFGGLIIYTVI